MKGWIPKIATKEILGICQKLLTLYFFNNKKLMKVYQMGNDMHYFVHNNSSDSRWFDTGSFAEGLFSMASDSDSMFIMNDAVVVTPDVYEQTSRYNSSEAVLVMSEDGCRPGYTMLKVVNTRHINNPLILDSIVPTHDFMYLSSDIFRENIVKAMRDAMRYPNWISHGPCVTAKEHKTDIASVFYCPNWPDDAMEWHNRIRVFGWPPETLINNIVKNGCHVVPIGDKCCEDALLQWRISFATAERKLIYSMNHTQFQVYALLKYMLNQIKYRLKRDIGEDDILCSYFMKTLLFHAVENSPQKLWQEKNIFVCFWLCFTMLLDWVHVGYCPNYFILSNKMFRAKVHGTNRTKLLQILHEVHQMKWRCFSVGNVHRPSIWEYLNNKSLQEWYLTPKGKLRFNDPCDYAFEHLLNDPIALTHGGIDTLRSLKSSLVLLSKTKSELEEQCAYRVFTRSLFTLARETLNANRVNGGNKSQYKHLKRCKHWAIHTLFGTKLLYLATFMYMRGNHRQALQLCRKVKALCRIPGRNESGRCSGTGDLIFLQLRELMIDFRISGGTEFCLPHLYPELRRESYMGIYPLPYAAFLSFLCSHDLGDSQGCSEELFNLETQCKVTFLTHFKIISLHHTLLGIAYQMKGDRHKAKEAYRKSLYYNPHRNPASERLKAL